MPSSRCSLWLAALVFALPAAARAEPTAHPLVAGFERFYTNPNAEAARGGQLLLTELNCLACHTPKDTSLARKQAPVLDAVAARVKVGFLRRFLADPHQIKPGTTMPDLFADDPERRHKVEALVHFLAATGSLKQEGPDLRGVAPGGKLYAEVGCVACHGTRDPAGKPDKLTATSVPLPDLKTKYSITSLAAFLENPLHARPAGRMPRLRLQAKEAKDIANYLLQGLKIDVTGLGTTRFAVYDGDFDKLPDFDRRKAAATGQSLAFDVSAAGRASNYALKFEGFFKVVKEGTYRFDLGSDDGSKLYIDGKVVVDNDGIHPPKWESGSVELTAGVHQVTVAFFQGGGGAELEVQVEGPGLPRQNFAGLVAATEADLDKRPVPKEKQDDPDAIDIQPALVEQGKVLFASVGCANCHQMVVDKKPLASTRQAPALADLKKIAGCLGDPAPPQGVPHYQLSRPQRNALKAVLERPSESPSGPKDVLARTMETFNCYACHERDKVGGPAEELNKSFLTAQPEMGDEGRLPPPLDGAGAKLNPAYLAQILDQGAHDRPYMLTRMPGFGAANVGHVPAALAALDKFPAAPAIEFDVTPPKVKAAARHLVGDNALGCIKCHTFAGNRAEGIQGIDLTILPRRLQRDWFHVYLLNPQKVRPGTRMPSAWTNGQSALPDVLSPRPEVQIEAIWVYLQDGASAQVPSGMSRRSIPLVPSKGAILYRNFIQGTGTRAIAVGYPEKAHLAFDANELRLSQLWQGAFIDAARHWSDRGAGFEGPLGDNVLSLPRGPDFALLAKPDQAWPTKAATEQGYHFRGYQLTADDRPTFLYSLGEVQVEDFPNALKGKDPWLRRELRLSGSPGTGNLYFRAAAGTKIEPAGDGWFKIDGWKLRLEADAKPEIRQSGGKSELLVPVRFTEGKARIVQEFVW